MAKTLKFPVAAAPEAPTLQLPAIRINHLLPYYAVFQAEIKQTLHSWIYRLWVILSVGAIVGYMMYRFGAKQVGGFHEPGQDMVNDLFQWIVWGSITLIIVLTAGTICGEKGNMADSILSRGISRYQYFQGKWHAKLVVILGTFLVLSMGTVASSILLLHSGGLDLLGSLIAVGTVCDLMTMIITCGVSISAIANTPLISISIVWMAIYGLGFMLSFLPSDYPSPERALQSLPDVLRGQYSPQAISRFVLGSLSASLVMAAVGMIWFSRKDV